MCLNPRKILNPSLSWTPDKPKYIVVQCNECSECRALKQQEWFVRSTEQFREYRSGSNFFVTLTFRDEDLPFFEDKREFVYESVLDHVIKTDYSEQNVYIRRKVKRHLDYRFPCFDGEMLTSFMKKFRTYVSRRFPNYDTKGIRFLICPEYGEHTRRPHYHCQIDCPFFLPIKDFKDICSRAWIHGWIGRSKNFGWLIQSEGACQYTAKYTNKDMYFYNQGMDKYLDKESLDEFEYQYRYEKVKRFLPRLRVSKGFGSSLARKIQNMPDPISYCCLLRPVQRLSRAEKVVHYALPRYILSKLTREIDKSSSKIFGRPMYKYTEFGKQLRKAMFEHRLDLDSIDLAKFQDEEYILATLSKLDFSNDLKRREYIARTLPPLFKYITPRNLSFYRRFLRYMTISPKYDVHSALWYNNRQKWFIDDFFSQEYIPRDLLCDCVNNDISPDSLGFSSGNIQIGMPLSEYGDLSQLHTLSELGQFRLYELASTLIDDYNSLHSHQRSRIIDKRNSRIDEVRNQLVDFVLYDARSVEQII